MPPEYDARVSDDANTSTSAQPLSMREVAALAGVSHQTVSRVINGHPSIRPETRQRVLEVIERVGYRPNHAARALASRRSRRLGVIVDLGVEFGPNATLRAIEQSAREAGYAVSAVTVGKFGDLTADGAVHSLLDQGVEALCVIAPRESAATAARTHAAAIPTLVVSSGADHVGLTAYVDQVHGARAATQHLIDLGHERIVHLAGPLDWLDAQGREQGWRSALKEAGLEVRPPVVGDWTADFGHAWAASWPADVPWTAVFCANDQMALGVIHGLAERGLRVPEDISVVGFDDFPEARHFLPPLTTVRQDFHELGERVVKALVAAIDGQQAPPARIVPELVVRASTAAPRG